MVLSFYSSGVPQNLVMYSGADGGDAPLGGQGGEGVLAQSGFNNSVIATVNTYNSYGRFPGGGGGAVVSGGSSVGANGLVIFHW